MQNPFINISNIYNLYKTYDYLLMYVLNCSISFAFVVLFFLILIIFAQVIDYIHLNKLAVVEYFENPSFKVNADLNETKIIYNNTFYARSSK